MQVYDIRENQKLANKRLSTCRVGMVLCQSVLIELLLGVLAACVGICATQIVNLPNHEQAVVDPAAHGRDVADATINLIEDTCIFPTSRFMMVRYIWGAGKFGEEVFTNRPCCGGDLCCAGMYQVLLSHWRESKSPSLTSFHRRLWATFSGLNWTQVTWEHGAMPLYSGLAAYLLFAKYVPEGTPWNTSGQKAILRELKMPEAQIQRAYDNYPFECDAARIDAAIYVDPELDRLAVDNLINSLLARKSVHSAFVNSQKQNFLSNMHEASAIQFQPNTVQTLSRSLSRIREVLKDRGTSTKIGLLVLFGTENRTLTNLVSFVDRLRHYDGVTVYVLWVGPMIPSTAWRLVDEPKCRRLFHYTTADKLKFSPELVVQQMCTEGAQIADQAMISVFPGQVQRVWSHAPFNVSYQIEVSRISGSAHIYITYGRMRSPNQVFYDWMVSLNSSVELQTFRIDSSRVVKSVPLPKPTMERIFISIRGDKILPADVSPARVRIRIFMAPVDRGNRSGNSNRPASATCTVEPFLLLTLVLILLLRLF